MARMMWRGVRNWPSSPACLICLQHVLEQIALGVGVGLVEAQPVDQGDHLRQHGRLVDRRAARRS